MKRFQKLFELTPEVVYTLDKKGKITYLSPAFEERTGWKVNDWIGKTFKGLIHPGDLPRALKVFVQVLAGKGAGPYELRVKKADSSYLVGEFTSAPFMEDGKIVGQVGIGRDVTERNRLSTELQRSRHQLQVIIKNISEGVTVLDSQGKLIFVNDAAAKASKYRSPEEMIKNPIKWTERFELKDEKGKSFPIERLPTRVAITTGKESDEIINFFDKKTSEDRWSLVKSRPAYGDEGKLSMVITIVSDITERMNIDKKKDEFMSVASHELKTPLTSLKIYSELLERKADKLGMKEIKKDVQNVSRQVARITSLISELFDISKIESNNLTLRKTLFYIHPLVKEVVKDMKTSFPTHKFIVNEIPSLKVNADREGIEQVLINLFSNAAKYSPEGSEIVVSISKQGSNLLCSITDEGNGIPKKEQKLVFERFYRVNDGDNSKGLGMGLYISNNIIKKHGGKISVKSKVGSGSTFSFTLPLD